MNKQQIEEKLAKIATYEEGWDSYGAAPPSEIAIENARSFLNTFPRLPHQVNASVVGGVGVTFRHGIRKVYVEFYNKGNANMLHTDGEKIDTYPLGLHQDGNIKYFSTTDLDKIEKYLEEYPRLTPLRVMTADLNELDWLVAAYVFRLPGLHYMRRESVYNTQWLICNKTDQTPEKCAGTYWNASAYWNDHPGAEDQFRMDLKTSSDHRAVPSFSSRIEDAVTMLRSVAAADDKVAWHGFLMQYMLLIDVHKSYGTADAISWLGAVLENFDPKKISQAVLLAVCETEKK